MENYLDSLLSGPVPRELSFPPEEYAARLGRVREMMAASEIDVLLGGGFGRMKRSSRS